MVKVAIKALVVDPDDRACSLLPAILQVGMAGTPFLYTVI